MTKMRQLIFLWSACFAVAGCMQQDAAKDLSPITHQDSVHPATVDSSSISRYISRYKLPKEVASGVFKAYATHQFQPMWTDAAGFGQQAHLAAAFFWKYLSIGLIDSAQFIPGMHQVFDALIENGHPGATTIADTDLEIVFTIQVVRFYLELVKAKSPESIGQMEWYMPLKKGDIDWDLLKIPKDFLESGLMHPQFHLLAQAMQKLKAIEQSGGWKPIAYTGKNLIPGDSSRFITLMKQRLQVTEPYAPRDTNASFNEKMVLAVRQFRKSVGLKDTALIDSAFVNRLNISVKKRIHTLTINLQRWKWMPPDTSTVLIRVNIPAFELEVLENGKSVKRMDAIIGTPNHHTVMFCDEIRNVVFNPYWNIPKSILAKELWPQIIRNRSYLQKHDMEIVRNGQPFNPNRIAWHRYNGYTFPYLVRQKPGPENPLGQVKFLFPNPYHIYIHDTPNKSLFEKEQRAFSHGCIRISEPLWLANYLLKEQTGWNTHRIDAAVANGQEMYVGLTHPVPVYITYITAWVDAQGILHFRDDVYEHDAQMERELFAKHASK